MTIEPRISDADWANLVQFARGRGRNWRAQLRSIWASGVDTDWQRRVRNIVGPLGLFLLTPSDRERTMTAIRKITVRITVNKNGRRMAHYWGEARRWLPMTIVEAEMMIANGTAWDHDDDD